MSSNRLPVKVTQSVTVLPVTDYRAMLIRRTLKLCEEVELEYGRGPISLNEYRNRTNLRKWKEKFYGKTTQD